MIPKSMKKPIWLAPACVLDLCLGIFLLLVYFFPDFAPRMHENMFRRGVYVIIPFISFICILSPLSFLWFCIWLDRKIEAGEMVEEDW